MDASNTSRHEIACYLSTVRNSISKEIKPALQDQTALRAADAIVLILGRIIQQLGESNEQVEAAHYSRVAALVDAFPGAPPRGSRRLQSVADELAIAQNLMLVTSDTGSPGEQSSNIVDKHWLKNAASTLEAMWNDIEDGVPPPVTPETKMPSNQDIAVTRAALETYLLSKYPRLKPGLIKAFELYYGGYVKQMARVTLSENEELPTTLVLRRDLAMSMTGTKSSDEFGIISRVYDLGLPVPRPILAEANDQILGGTFLIMEEVADAKPAGSYFSKERAQEPSLIGQGFGESLAKLLAELHSKTATVERKADQAEASQRTLQEQLIDMRKSWYAADKPARSLSVDLSLDWLIANPLAPDRPHCLVHGDCGMHNLLVRDGDLVALVDWELAHDGDPAEDLAMIRMMVADNIVIGWHDFAKAYISHGGNPAACEPKAVAYYSLLLFTRHLIGATGLRPHYFSGAGDNAISASVLTHSVDRMMQYQCRALNLALTS
jgi:aminoglycoside phosphotransferase (APT) family kinase protein